jgi:RES domain-containing protein
MEIFKISNETYSKAITSSGVANRWNKAGEFVTYAASSRSLATLEMVARRSCILPASIIYKMMVLSINDDDKLFKQIKISDLPTNWTKLDAYPKLQEIGSDWYSNQETLILQVPSAIIPKEYNFVINTKHPLFLSNVNLTRTEDYFWDDRLL